MNESAPSHWPADHDDLSITESPYDKDGWKRVLDADSHAVLRGHGTEPPFENAYHDCKAEGSYRCRGCGRPLFASRTKYDSGTGWPSFFAPVDPRSIETVQDHKLFMARTEVRCARCGGHLGHVFDDGPAPTGKRYCMNSGALVFSESDQ